MEDVIGIEVLDKKQGKAAFITWGRVFDTVDAEPIERVIAQHAAKFGLLDVKSISVCCSLQDVAQFPYFYEALISVSWKPIPFGKKYKAGAAKKRRELTAGKEIYFLGISRD